MSKCSRTEPCGTPNVSVEVLDLKPLIGSSCFYDIDKFQTFFFFFCNITYTTMIRLSHGYILFLVIEHQSTSLGVREVDMKNSERI